MNAIDLTTTIGDAKSLHPASDLYSKKRAKLGAGKKTAIDQIYDGFLKATAVPIESKDSLSEYQDIIDKHGMLIYVPDINKSKATGAKKLRVGEVVTTAAVKFSDAVSVKRPVEISVLKEVEKPVIVLSTPEEPAKVEEMTRTKRHEEASFAEPTVQKEEPVVPTVDEASNRRLDSYLSSGVVSHSGTIEDQKMDKLAKKLSEIDAITRKATELQSQANDLLAQEHEMDAKINAALEKANDDYFSATQSLDKVTEQIRETQENIRRKQELLNRLNNSKIA